jgi:hypothetical protein
MDPVMSRFAPADRLLALIAAIMSVAALAGATLSLGMGQALGVASLPAGGTIGYALFVYPDSN